MAQGDTPIIGQTPKLKEHGVSKSEEEHRDTDEQPSAKGLKKLGWSHLEQYRGTGTLGDLEKAIEYFSRAVSWTPDDDPDLSSRLNDLGIAYNDRFHRLGALSDFEGSVTHISRAIELTSDDHPDRLRQLASLGVSYGERYRRLDELADLEKATECFSRVLALTPDGHPDMPLRHAHLGQCYIYRHRRLGELADIEKSNECFTRALALTPDGHPDISRRHTDLGQSYAQRYRRLGELADIEKAIKCHSRALALTPNRHPDISVKYSELGVSFTQRYQRLGELADLEKSMDYQSRALALTPDGHSDMSARHADLAMSYSNRYTRLGDLADLEKSIQLSSRALVLTLDNHPSIPARHADLGTSYINRFRRLGDLADLEKAIQYLSRALLLTPDGHSDMSGRHALLGMAYIDRFRRLGEFADLEKAIECHSHALALVPDGHPDMPLRLAHLGLSYYDRYRHLGELADLEKGLECHSRALALTPDGHPHMSYRHAALGASYGDRYRSLDELADLDKSIDHKSRALALTPDGHPDISVRHGDLGAAYDDRYRRLGEPADLEASLNHSTRALEFIHDDHPESAERHFNYAIVLLSQYQHTTQSSLLHKSLSSFRTATRLLTGAPRNKFQYALRWANHACDHSLLNPIEAYQTTIDLLPQFIWLGASANQRYQDLSLTENLAVKSCYAAIRCSNHSLALEWLEHARCVVWNQSLMLRTPLDELHSSYPDLATHLESIASQLQTTAPGSVTSEQAGQQRRHLATEYQSLLGQTRQLPGFETFLQPLKASELMHAARDGPVVVINCHTDQCDALFIIPGNKMVGHLALPNFTEEKAQQARSELEAFLRQKGLRQRGVRVRPQPGYDNGIESVLMILWSDIVKPVLDYLGYMEEEPKERLPHITWCPTGPLSFLPLHAAGDYSQPQSRIYNYAISSYIPTLSALLTSTPRSFDQNCRLLAIGQANTPGHNPLPGTTRELAYVKAHAVNNAEYSQLTDSQATTAAVLDAMEQHDWVHLACHAHQNVKNPTQSGFHLHDSTLDLSAINQRSFKNKGLAFLSACQTATGDKNLPDEVIHLASGMLMAGYPSVIATMWSVVDDDAPFVADKVYAQLMKDGKLGNGEAGRALHYAVEGLREKVGEKEFGRWVPYIHIGS
ncbi:hypothetical protein ACGC1H_002423 [Rhizoctonia solani]